MDESVSAGPAYPVIRWACWYDLVGEISYLRAVRQTLIGLAAPSPGERVLDVGCGTGTLAIAMKARVGGGAVHGIDASTEMIEVARAKAASCGVRVHFEVARVEALPFPDASFDLVTSCLMLHHLSDQAKREGLAEVRRVLKPGGRLWALDLASQSHAPLSILLGILGHPRGPSTVETMLPMLARAGFSHAEAIPAGHRNFAFLRAR